VLTQGTDHGVVDVGHEINLRVKIGNLTYEKDFAHANTLFNPSMSASNRSD
jgi:hypothetical protein